MKYSILKGLKKSIKVIVLFAIPVLIDAFWVSYPEIAQLTVGGLLNLGWNFLKVRGVPVIKSI